MATALGVPSEGRRPADVLNELAPRFDSFIRSVGLAVSLAKDGLSQKDSERLAALTMAPENKSMRDSNCRPITAADALTLSQTVLSAA